MQQDDQENPWPGFVDIMSSTLLVFVFLVIIQLLLIAGVSMKIGETVSKKQFEQLLEENMSEAAASSIEQQPSLRPKQRSALASDADRLTILYSNLDTLLNAKENLRTDGWIVQHKQQMLAGKVHISGFIGLKDLSISTSSFVSFNRVMDIRSRIIEQGVPADNITVRISDTAPDNDAPKNSNIVIIEIHP